MATQTIASKVTLAAGATTINQTSLTVTSTLGVVPGAVLYHANIPSGTTISSVTNATTIVMSANATATGSSLAVVAINPAIVNVDLIARGTWANNDTLAITEGQQIEINTVQSKVWGSVLLEEGSLRIYKSDTIISLGINASGLPFSGLDSISVEDGEWLVIESECRESLGRIYFNSVLVEDTSSIYCMYFEEGYGTDSAIVVNDRNGIPICGEVTGASSIDFTYAYTSNIQRGAGTANTEVSIIIMASGVSGGQFVSVSGSVLKGKNNIFFLNSSPEFNYVS